MALNVIVASGGMDSVTAAYLRKDLGCDIHLVGFDYGQRHRKELESLKRIADHLQADLTIVDLSGITPLLKGNSLTDPSVVVPDGHYAEETMRITVVPNRNAIMINIAAGIAQAEGAEAVVVGVHGGDHFIYPDCRPEFIVAQAAAIHAATDGAISLLAPFLTQDKTAIAKWGGEHGVPYDLTWSCYKGGAIHCGTCGTCYERKEAFTQAGVKDPTIYEVEGLDWYKPAK